MNNSIKVLMFGWEFPPHMSGGLGTACAGITHGLLANGTAVVFVVPRAYGDEDVPLLSASDAWDIEDQNQAVRERWTVKKNHLETHVLSSVILPYSTTLEPREEIMKWNWEHPSKLRSRRTSVKKKRYLFSGGYGSNLLDEVKRYAEVAGEIALKCDFDIIHAHDWVTYMAGINAKTVSGKPLIIHVHATEFDRADEYNVNPRVIEVELAGLLAADLIIAVSQWTKDVIVKRYGIDRKKIKVVHNGVIESELFNSSFPKISDQVVTYMGRITYQKGPQYFIDAAFRVLKHLPDVHFIMAGSGDLLPEMVERVAQLGLSSRIHFTGFLGEKLIHQIWTVTDLYVMPSVSEPFGITPLEAIQAGIPTIISNQSGVSEVIENAIKVNFWETNALADAIISVLKHRALSDALRTNSKKELKSLTWRHTAKKINSLYHELIA